MLLRPVSISVLNATLPSVLLSPLKFSIIVNVTLSSTLTIIFPDWLLSLPLTLIYNVWPLVSLSAFTSNVSQIQSETFCMSLAPYINGEEEYIETFIPRFGDYFYLYPEE